MTRRGKVFLIVAAVVGGVMVTCIGGAVFWWSQHGEELMDAARKSGQEGAAFGTGAADAETCITEGLRRAGECDRMAIACMAGSRAFTKACLGTAPTDETICEGVPDSGEISGSIDWISGQCSARGQADNPGCQNVLSALQDHCAGKPTP